LPTKQGIDTLNLRQTAASGGDSVLGADDKQPYVH